MDGNGRWAKQRHLPRVEGHRNGVESVRAVVRTACEVGIKYLTLYAFSVENWNRPKHEVDTLMTYLARYLNAGMERKLGTATMGVAIASEKGVPNHEVAAVLVAIINHCLRCRTPNAWTNG
jgi:undecaprenyl diphosphate synthase